MLELGNVATGADPAAELLAFLETYSGQQLIDLAAEHVMLGVTQPVYAAIEADILTVDPDIVTALLNLGVDEVKVIGSTDPEHDLHNP